MAIDLTKKQKILRNFRRTPFSNSTSKAAIFLSVALNAVTATRTKHQTASRRKALVEHHQLSSEGRFCCPIKSAASLARNGFYLLMCKSVQTKVQIRKRARLFGSMSLVLFAILNKED